MDYTFPGENEQLHRSHEENAVLSPVGATVFASTLEGLCRQSDEPYPANFCSRER